MTKRFRGEPNDDHATRVLAATKPSHRDWLLTLPGWAPDTATNYCEITTLGEVTERPTGEGLNNSTIETQVLAATGQIVVPQDYERFRELFEQPENPELPEHGPHDHTIPIEEGKQVACRKIYPISEKESQILQAYIEE